MDKYTSVEHAAKELGLHVQSVRKLIHTGALPAFRRAGEKGFLIRSEDVAKLKAERSALVPVAPVPEKPKTGKSKKAGPKYVASRLPEV